MNRCRALPPPSSPSSPSSPSPPSSPLPLSPLYSSSPSVSSSSAVTTRLHSRRRRRHLSLTGCHPVASCITSPAAITTSSSTSSTSNHSRHCSMTTTTTMATTFSLWRVILSIILALILSHSGRALSFPYDDTGRRLLLLAFLLTLLQSTNRQTDLVNMSIIFSSSIFFKILASFNHQPNRFTAVRQLFCLLFAASCMRSLYLLSMRVSF